MKRQVCLSCSAPIEDDQAKSAVPFKKGIRYQHVTWQECQQALARSRFQPAKAYELEPQEETAWRG